MPTYVYECSACSETYEVEQRITEDALTTCRCGSDGTVRRVIQPVGIAFKGGGFYVTDSGSSTTVSTETKAEAPMNCGTADSPCACAKAAESNS